MTMVATDTTAERRVDSQPTSGNQPFQDDPAGAEQVLTRRRGLPLMVMLVIALVIAVVAAAGIGAFPISPGEVITSILRKLGISSTVGDQTAEAVLWDIRLPRIALSVLVGAALGCAGAAMQGTFANPLAEPGIVGVSAGASLGAVIAIVAGATALGTWSLPAAAFAGGLATVVGVYVTARADGRTEVITLVLTGVAVNAMVGAFIGLATFLSDDSQLRSITFWTLGSMAQASWAKVAVVAPLVVLGVAASLVMSRQLDLLALGERQAGHLGVDVERLRIVMLAVIALLTAGAVAVSGMVLFVGLVIPHLIRMIAGPTHRVLIPASALAGALVLVLADLTARTIAAPQELPLGVLTSLVGSPFFFWQLRRTRASQGGWS